MKEKYLTQSHLTRKPSNFPDRSPMKMIWTPPEYGTLKLNTDAAFANRKIGIGILIRNFLVIPILAREIPRQENFSVHYGELRGIIEG